MDSNTIRLIDVAFVGKSESGEVVGFELTELDPDVQEALDRLGIEVQGLLNEDDIADAAEELKPNLVGRGDRVGERLGTSDDAGHQVAGGVLLAFERLPHEVVQAAREWALEEASKA